MAGKIGADVKNGEANSFEDSASNIKDAIRYTATFDINNFVNGYFDVKNNLESDGYKEIRCKNFFNTYDKDGGIKSVQCTYENKD